MTKIKIKFASFLSLVLAASSMAGRAATTYSWDTGPGSFSTVSGSHQVLLVSFQATQDNLITGMQFYHFWNLAQDHAMGFHLWLDPTNDGNPADAVLASSVAGMADMTSPGGLWQTVDFPAATAVPVGSRFFVGISFDDPTFSYFLGNADNGGGTGNSWEIRWPQGGLTQPSNLGSGSLTQITGSDTLIRAIGVPEPGTAATLGLGALILLRRRRA